MKNRQKTGSFETINRGGRTTTLIEWAHVSELDTITGGAVTATGSRTYTTAAGDDVTALEDGDFLVIDSAELLRRLPPSPP